MFSSPFPTLSLPLGFAFLHFLSTLLLSLVDLQSSAVVLLLPLVQYALQYAGATLWTRYGRTSGGAAASSAPAEGHGRVAWQLAALETTAGLCRIFASRLIPTWVWATLAIYTPFFASLLHPSTLPSGDARLATIRHCATAGISAAALLLLWRTNQVYHGGVLLSLVAAACEAKRQAMLADAMEGPHRGEEKQEETLDLAPFFLKNASLRSAALHFVAYLVLGSQNASRARVQPVRVAALVFLPLVTALATGVLQFALSTASFDFFAASTAYYASTAFLLVTLLFLGINPSHIVSRMYLVIMIPHIVLYALCRYFAAATGDLPKSAPAHTPLSPSPAASTSTPSVRTVRIIAALAILFPISWYIHLANTLHTVDLVFAHYSMPLNDLRSHIEVIKAARLVNTSRTRVIIYEKGEFTDEQLWEALAGVAQEGWDEIVHLPNYAREGGTYLEHIVTRYNDTLPGGPRRFSVEAAKHHGQRLWRKKRPIADHTLFMQSHLAWHWLAGPRLANALHRNTGFLSFGPYLSNLCGSDSEGTGFYPGAKSIYKEVLGKECTEGKEEDRVLSTWAGQFAVSRERVMSNGWEVYEKMREWIEAPNDDPLHHLWNPSGPSTQDNPAFGHSLERSWPLVFRCLDPKIAKECPEAEYASDKCQCFGLA